MSLHAIDELFIRCQQVLQGGSVTIRASPIPINVALDKSLHNQSIYTSCILVYMLYQKWPLFQQTCLCLCVRYTRALLTYKVSISFFLHAHLSFYTAVHHGQNGCVETLHTCYQLSLQINRDFLPYFQHESLYDCLQKSILHQHMKRNKCFNISYMIRTYDTYQIRYLMSSFFKTFFTY